MDRTGWIVVILCFVLLLVYPVALQKFYPPKPLPPKGPATAAETAQAPAHAAPASPSQSAPAAAGAPALPKLLQSSTVEENAAPEKTVFLSNSLVRYELTTLGGGVKRVLLNKHFSEGDEPVVLNRGSNEAVFNLRGWFPQDIVSFELVSAAPNEVVFARNLEGGARLLRKFTLGDNYEMGVVQTIDGSKLTAPLSLPEFRLNLGLASSVHLLHADRMYVKAAWMDINGKYHSEMLSSFDGTHFIFQWSSPRDVISSPAGDPLRWAAVKDQFFVMLLEGVNQPFLRLDARKELLPQFKKEYESVPDGIAGSLVMAGVLVEPGKSVEQVFRFYGGPKEDSVLAKLENNKDKVMEFGWMAWVSKPLLWAMNSIHSVVGNYGWSIVILTILLKALLWYPQSKANLSMKRMQVVAPLMKQVQEKFKDNPAKMNEETLKVYRDYGVNPIGGCLPLLIQMPLFLGFYYMLQSSIELRHASFLWIHDLSMPDTVYSFPFLGMNIKINPMPLLMAATMYISMHMTPQTAGVDNPAQKIIKFMPLIFLLFCYNFASALSLYWTVQNILSIFQMYINLKTPLPDLEKMKAQAAARAKAKKKR